MSKISFDAAVAREQMKQCTDTVADMVASIRELDATYTEVNSSANLAYTQQLVAISGGLKSQIDDIAKNVNDIVPIFNRFIERCEEADAADDSLRGITG